MTVLTNAHTLATVGNPTPVKQILRYYHPLKRNTANLTAITISDDVIVIGRRHFHPEKCHTSCKPERSSSCSSHDNEETADEMTSQGQRSGHIPASVCLKKMLNMAANQMIVPARQLPIFCCCIRINMGD
jgi:hypothetical protein